MGGFYWSNQKMVVLWPLAFLAFDLISAQQISGYGPGDVEELNPLTLSRNQVHFLVRENLLAIDELREEQDSIYKELHECFGLEKCRKEENDQTVLTGPPPHGLDIQAGALLTMLRETRAGLEGQHSVLEQSIRQTQRIYDQTASFQSQSSHSSSRTSYSSSSSSSNRITPEYDEYDDGPVPNRG